MKIAFTKRLHLNLVMAIQYFIQYIPMLNLPTKHLTLYKCAVLSKIFLKHYPSQLWKIITHEYESEIDESQSNLQSAEDCDSVIQPEYKCLDSTSDMHFNTTTFLFF